MTQIVIDLGEVFADEATVSEAIIARAAAMLLEDYELKILFRKRVENIADAEILRQIEPLVEEALEAAVQPTDGFGNPRGEPTTLHMVVVKRVTEELKTAGQRDSVSRHRENLLDQIVGREVSRVVGEDLREAMKEARRQVRDAVEKKGAEILAETIHGLARR